MGFFLFFALSLLAACAALAVVVRAELRGRTEIVVAGTLVWNGLIALPIYVLGLLGHLTAHSLALLAPAVFLATLAAATRGVGVGALAQRVVDAGRGLLRLPIDALQVSWRARSLIFVGVAFLSMMLPYLAVSAYLAQPQPRWDPLWYHDTMVGLTIQNHGFAVASLPDTLQKANGYARLGEMTQLWMVIFWDRRLADMTNLLFAPALAAGTYLLARRYASRLLSLGWGVAVMMVPTALDLLHSTFIDTQYGVVLLGGIVFATIDKPRLRDGWLASLGLALAIGSKGLALTIVPPVGLIGAWLLIRAHWRDPRRGAAIATVVAGAIGVIAMGSVTYLRNYLNFHNPLWPDLRVDIPELGIHWPGTGPWSSESNNPNAKVNLNLPLSQLLEHLTALPWSGKTIYFEQAVEYGIGMVWVGMPMAALAFAGCVIHAARAVVGRVLGEPPPRARVPLALALILAVTVLTSPALWAARYYIGIIPLIAALAAWLTGRPSRARLGESAVSIVIVTSIMMFWWTPLPRWYYTPEQLLKSWHASPVEREVDKELGGPVGTIAGLARERELGPGTLLVFGDRYSGFPSLFWNCHFSNRVMYLKGGADWLGRAARAGATWIFLHEQDGNLALARAPGSGWQEIGVLNWINSGVVLRRAPGAKPPPPPAAPVAGPTKAAPPPAAPLPTVFGPPAPPPPPPPPPLPGKVFGPAPPPGFRP